MCDVSVTAAASMSLAHACLWQKIGCNSWLHITRNALRHWSDKDMEMIYRRVIFLMNFFLQAQESTTVGH